MMSGYRLKTGGTGINRDKPLRFTWDGENCSGVQGDSLASALMSSGKRTVARGFIRSLAGEMPGSDEESFVSYCHSPSLFFSASSLPLAAPLLVRFNLLNRKRRRSA